MKVAGIVAEYNPFHNGHAHQIEMLRKKGYDTIICVCSPAVVQRGSFALFPLQVRAKAALLSGADLIITLPAPYACKSAEGFAHAAVYLLCALGVCDVICFGTENASENELMNIAQLLNTEKYENELLEHLSAKGTYASARESAAREIGIEGLHLMQKPNNTLGIEYCRALLNFYDCENSAQINGQAAKIFNGENVNLPEKRPKPLAINRTGANHDEPLATHSKPVFENFDFINNLAGIATYNGNNTDGEKLSVNPAVIHSATGKKIASATALRDLFLHGKSDEGLNYVPKQCAELYTAAIEQGMVLSPQKMQIAILARLRGITKHQFAQIRLTSEGLENKLFKSVQKCNNLHELYTELKSKRYTHARVRRLVLDAALNYGEDLPFLPPYVHIAGASSAGLKALKKIKKACTLKVSHSLAVLASKSEAAQKVATAHSRAQDIAALCMEKTTICGTAFTDKLIIVEDAD